MFSVLHKYLGTYVGNLYSGIFGIFDINTKGRSLRSNTHLRKKAAKLFSKRSSTNVNSILVLILRVPIWNLFIVTSIQQMVKSSQNRSRRIAFSSEAGDGM